MIFSQRETGSSLLRKTTSVRWVMTSSAVLLSNSKTLWMRVFSISRIVPFSAPASSIIKISSSVILSFFSSGLIPRRRKTIFVEAVRNQTKGANILAITKTKPDMLKAIFSACCIARRLGTSSPKIKVT